MLRTFLNLITDPAPKHRAQGPDVSHWNVTRTPGQPVTTAFNPDTAREPIDFVFQKVTEGGAWIDPMIAENWEGVKKVPIRFAYHYQRAGVSWTQQVNHFYRTASRYDFHGFVIDVEKTFNWDGTRPITGDTFFQDTRRMIEQLWSITTKPVILYTNKDIYQSFLRPAIERVYGGNGIQWLEEDPRLWLWYSQYWLAWSVNKEPSLPPTRKPGGWDFWQVTEAGHGPDWGVKSLHVDVNVYNGTTAELTQRLGLTPTPPTEPDPPTEPPIVVTPPSPEPMPEVWTGKIISFSRMIVRKYPEVGTETDSGHRLFYGDKVHGKLWVGNGYLWMQLDGAEMMGFPGHDYAGKWVAVRRHPEGDKFISLDPNTTVPPPPTPDGLITVRVVWDDENPDFKFKCRTLTETQIRSKSPPAVNRFYPKPRDKMGDFRADLSDPDWKPAIIALNGGGHTGKRRWDYLTGRARATYNKGEGESGWPMQMYVVFSGNKLRGRFVGDWFEFETLKPHDLPRVGNMTIETHPHLVHRFTCVGWNGFLKKTKRIASTNTQWGQVYHYCVSEEGKGYIPRRHVVVE